MTGRGSFKFPKSEGFYRGYVSGEAAVLAEVYRDYVDEVRAMARRHMRRYGLHESSRYNGDAEDLVQEVFIRAFSVSAREKYDSSRPFGPFLGTLARNVLTDCSRRRGAEVPTLDVERLAGVGEMDAETNASQSERSAIASRHVSSLPTELKRVHEQLYVLGRSQAEACGALALTRQQLRTRDRRLRAGLRQALFDDSTLCV